MRTLVLRVQMQLATAEMAFFLGGLAAILYCALSSIDYNGIKKCFGNQRHGKDG